MKRLWVTIFLSLALAACSGCAGLETQEQQIAAGCATASGAIKVLAVANTEGKFTAEQRETIGEAIGYVSPICDPADGQAPTLDTLKREAFTSAILILQQEAAKL